MSDKARLLVVDDDEDFRFLLEFYLKKQGYEVITANDGVEAVEIGLKYEIDLLLLDLMMPKMDGFQVASILTEKLGTKAPKIIIITGRNLVEEEVALLLAGVSGAMHKPIKTDELGALVAKVLANRPEDSPWSKINKPS